MCKVNLTNIQISLSTLEEQIEEIQQRVGANEDNIQSATVTIVALEKEVTMLKCKNQEREDEMRRANFHLVGLPEGAEKRDLVAFLGTWIPQRLGEQHVATPLPITKAYRIASKQPTPDSRRIVFI